MCTAGVSKRPTTCAALCEHSEAACAEVAFWDSIDPKDAKPAGRPPTPGRPLESGNFDEFFVTPRFL